VALALLGVMLQIPVLTSAGMLLAGAALLVAQRLAQALHRPLGAVLFGNMGADARTARPLQPADAAIFLRYARRVVIVPGYGLAAAQAQHKLEELIRRLTGAGVQVTLAVHPMAGRMPGQLLALLTEAGVPERLILPMEGLEEALRAADVALLIGANDVANPAASALRTLPVFGMPLIPAALAEKLYVIKRGAGLGFAAIENRAFQGENCNMIRGDALTVLVQMLDALKVAEVSAAA
jgi:NAD(P) transhydrogenase subunit beta